MAGNHRRRVRHRQEHVVTDERDGSVGGYHIEKWDGSQDAIVNVKPAGVGVSVNGKERVR
jgi:hypothetical protein